MNINNFYFPFEGDKHLCTCICLPYREDTWSNKGIDALKEYYEVIKAISFYEPVIVIYSKNVDINWVKNVCELPNVFMYQEEYDDAWARDTLPVFLKDKNDNLVGIDYGFILGEKLLNKLDIPRISYKDFILEGGSIHSNGKGRLLTTSCCLLSKGRNPNLNQKQITEKLKSSLNINDVCYLPNGIVNDETSGHVDNIACYLNEDTVCLAYTDDVNDEQYNLVREDEKVLINAGYKLQKLYLPKPIYLTKEEEDKIVNNGTAIKRTQGRRLAASYVNFYMGEEYIILPQFNDKNDRLAIDTLNNFYQGKKKIIPIYSKQILLGGGNIHCITKQIPYSNKYKGEIKL